MFSKLFGFSNERNFLKWTKDLNFDCKTTQALKTVRFPIPKQVRIHMNQHGEIPCVPMVKKGDEVKVGQVIAVRNEFPTALIHASIFGRVTKIGDALLENGIKTKEVIIEADELQSIDPEIKPPLIHHKQDFIKALEKSGIVELNTTDFWRAIEEGVASIGTLLVNATLLEPFVATSIREILESPDDVLKGMAVLMKQLNIEKGIIGIEHNQIESVACLKAILANESQKYANISLKLLTSSYSSGLTQRLIQACGEGLLENNILVLNVATVGMLSRYLETGMPVIDVSVSVNGSAVSEPKNVLVPIGAPIKDVIAFCGGYKAVPKKILLGGPLMGTAVLSDEVTVSKQTTALFALDKKEAEVKEETECIRCARCIQVCPMKLMPISIDQSVRYNQLDALTVLNLAACALCGSCSCVCPASRHLVQTIRLGQSLLKREVLSQPVEKGVV